MIIKMYDSGVSIAAFGIHGPLASLFAMMASLSLQKHPRRRKSTVAPRKLLPFEFFASRDHHLRRSTRLSIRVVSQVECGCHWRHRPQYLCFSHRRSCWYRRRCGKRTDPTCTIDLYYFLAVLAAALPCVLLKKEDIILYKLAW